MITVFSYFGITSVLLYFQKNRKIFRRFAILFILVLLIFSGNNVDYQAYNNAFQGKPSPFEEAIGYLWIFRIFNSIGLTNYRYVLVLVGALIAFTFYKWGKYNQNTYYVVYLYMLFLLYYDVIQVRNTIIAFLTAFSFLLFIKGKKIIALVPLIIAPLFHIMAVFTDAIVLYIYFKKPRKDWCLSNIETLIYIAIGIMALFGRNIVNYLIYNIPQLYKARIYMASAVDYKSFVIWFTSGIIMVFTLWNYGVRYVLSKNNNKTSVEKKRSINFLFRFSMFCIPFSMVTLWMDEVVRIFRLFFLMMFFLYAEMRDEIRPRNRQIIFAVMAFVNIAFMVVWMIRGIRPDHFWG